MTEHSQNTLVSGAAAAGHRRLPAHDRPPVRRAREVDPRARGGDEGRQADPAGGAEEREPGRSRPRGHLPRRHGLQRPAAAQAARRHGQGAGRGQRPRPGQELRRQPALLPGPGRGPDRGRGRGARDRGPGARGGGPVRAVCEAQQEGAARGPGLAVADRRAGQARRHRGGPPVAEDLRQAGAARDRQPGRAPGAALRLHGERDLGPAGGKAHPLPRQAADGEDAARVLPQRADEGDPEGAGRARGRQGRGLRARGSGSRRPSSPRRRATRPGAS